MIDLNLQTKINRGHNYGLLSGLKLKDGLFAVYSNKDIILFNNNLSSKNISSYDSNDYYESIKSIKQLKNGKIIYCNYNLFIINYDVTTKKVDLKKIEIKNKEKDCTEQILDVVELYNGTILGITPYSLYKIKMTDENSEVTSIYNIPDEWLPSWENKDCYEGNLNIYDLKNDKLLLHSYSIYIRGSCILGGPKIIRKKSGIYVLDLTDFELIYLEEFPEIAKIVILNNYICINYSDSIFIYDINNYKILQIIESGAQSINKYNDNIIIALNIQKIIFYNLSDLNNIESQIFFCKCFNRYYFTNKSFVIKIDHKKLLISNGNNLGIVYFSGKFNFMPDNNIKQSIKKSGDENNKWKKKLNNLSSPY